MMGEILETKKIGPSALNSSLDRSPGLRPRLVYDAPLVLLWTDVVSYCFEDLRLDLELHRLVSRRLC